MVLWRTSRTRGPWVRAAVVACCVVPVIVAVSRVYRGMHHVSDVVFGAIGGGIWLLVVVTVLLWTARPDHRVERATADATAA